MDNSAKPFVKWAGGKTQLLKDIEISIPDYFMNQENIIYVEPFVGGGAVLFWILHQYHNIQKAIINDINSELISTYRMIKKFEKLVKKCPEVLSCIPILIAKRVS